MTLRRFAPNVTANYAGELDLQGVAPEIVAELVRASRPLLIYGWGLRLGGAIEDAAEFAAALGVPVAATWAVRDAFPQALCFGTHGTKAGNLAVQNADYILAIGTRLDTKATSSPVSLFAPNARLSMVDVDYSEMAKMPRYGRPLYRSVQADARDFLRHALPWAREHSEQNKTNDADAGYVAPWQAQVAAWQRTYVPRDQPMRDGRERAFHGPYSVLEKVGALLTGDEIIVADTGNTLGWLMQAFAFKGQRFLHPFNNTPMGYALPAALAASIATGKRVIVFTGDGSIMMNIGELATIAKHCKNVKVMLFRNDAHSMCVFTQKQWLQGRTAGTKGGRDGDLAFPGDFAGVANAMGNENGWNAVGGLTHWKGLDHAIKEWLTGEANRFLEVMIDPDASLAYQVKFGKPLEDCDPNDVVLQAG